MRNIVLLILLILSNTAFSQQIFHDLPSLLQFSEEKSINLKNNNIKEQQAKKAKLAALLGVLDPQINTNASFINNTQLPVSILPADAFGGPAGTTKEIQTGTHYNTSLQNTIDIKLLNLEAWKNLKLAKINIEITETDTKINRKNLFENIAAAYYNIVQLQEQLKITQKNSLVSDSLLTIVQNKYNAGLVKQQDVNDSKVNVLTVQENVKQITFLIEQNYLSLKILADIPLNEMIVIDEIMHDLPILKPEIKRNNLSTSSIMLKEKYTLQDYKINRLLIMPTISFVSSQAFNQYNQNFTIAGGNWINSSYVGLKLSMPLPNTKSLTNKFNAKYNFQLAQQNAQQAIIKSDLEFQKLGVEWDKAQSQFENNEEILKIQKDTYLKNKNLFVEGLQSLDKTLNSLNTLVNAEYNLTSSKISVLLAKAKIDINNQIK